MTTQQNDPKEDLHNKVDRSFTYHAPVGGQALLYTELRDAYKDLAHKIVDFCPVSRELAMAITELEASSMWSNKAIAVNKG